MLLICVMAFLGTILPVLWSNTRATHCVFMWTIWKWSHCPTKRFLLSQGMSISRPVSGRSAFRQWPRGEKCIVMKKAHTITKGWNMPLRILSRNMHCHETSRHNYQGLKYALSRRKAWNMPCHYEKQTWPRLVCFALLLVQYTHILAHIHIYLLCS